MASETAKLLRTSVRIKGEVYGATSDAEGPIGGGRGYRRAITSGDFSPTNIDELLDVIMLQVFGARECFQKYECVKVIG